MPEDTPRIVPCPTCSKSVHWTQSNPYRPFCSERCKLIDLGAWADEQHTSLCRDGLDGVEHGLGQSRGWIVVASWVVGALHVSQTTEWQS